MATFTNQAALAYNNTVTQSNEVQGEILEVLSVTKTPVTPTYAPDESVAYAISIINTGAAPYTNLTVTDNLGAYPFDQFSLVPLNYVDNTARYYVNGVLQPAPAVNPGPPLTFTGINVPAGGNALIVFSTRANFYAPLGAGGTVNNTVTVTGAGLTAPVTDTATINAEDTVRLSLNKAMNPTTVAEGQPITITLTVSNAGSAPATAADNAVISDTFNPPITITGVTFDGAPWTSPANYTYDPATGAFSTVPGQITAPAATYTQDVNTGVWEVTPGVSTLVINGTM